MTFFKEQMGNLKKKLGMDSSPPPPSSSVKSGETEKKNVCLKCKARLHYKDTHLSCFRCLGAFHPVGNCGACSKLSISARNRRRKAMNIFLATGSWPKSLDAVDNSSYKSILAKAKKSPAIVEEEASTSKPQGGENELSVLEKSVAPEVVPNLLDEEGDNDQSNLKTLLGVEGAEAPEEHVETDVVVVDLPPPPPEEDPTKMFEEFQLFMKQRSEIKRKAGMDNQPPPPKNPRVDLSKEPLITNLQSQVSSVDTKLNVLLSRLPAPPPSVDKSKGAIPKTPKTPYVIPKKGDSLRIEDLETGPDLVIPPEGDKTDEVIEEGDKVEGEGDELDEEDDLDIDPYDDVTEVNPPESISKRASRNIWLAALPEICPDLPQLKPVKTSEKGKFFKTMKQKKENPLMPFIPEINEICVDACTAKTKKVNVSNIEKFYETDQTYEQQLLGLRSVPSALSKEVHPKHIKGSGSSEQNARLNPKNKYGVQERLSLESLRFAGAYLKLCNNFQLALTSLESQLEKCKLQADLLGSKPFESDKDKQTVQTEMEDLIHGFNVMSLAIKDMSNTNGDFLSAASQQYGLSARSRATAWVEAASLPKGVKKEILLCDLQEPDEVSTKPLHIISPEAQSVLKNYVSERKEKTERAVLVKSLRGNNNQRGKQRGNKQGRSSFKNPQQYQQFQEFTKAQTSWNNRGRGNQRGGNTRGRGNHRGRGRGGPFPAPQNKQSQ